jgi:intein/homing endonuclease
LIYNDYPGTCSRCGRSLAPDEGVFLERPLRIECLLCVSGLQERLAQFPIVDEDGVEIDLMDFQREDSLALAACRKKLIGSQMGTGKCRYARDLAVLNGVLIEAHEAWSRYRSSDQVFDGEGWWSKPNEPLFVNAIDDETGKIVRKRIVNLYRQEVHEKLVRVKLNDGSETTVTKVHKLRGPEEWTNEIKVGDRICVPSKLLHEDGDLDVELAELFGWMIGDGHENRNSAKTTMVVTQKDTAVLERIRSILEKFGYRASLSDHDGTGRASDVRLSSAGWRSFCESLDYPWGTLSKDRRVPSTIMQAGPGPVSAFLRAYFDADGSVPKGCRYIEFSTASLRLAKELSVLLRRFGVWVRIRKKRARATNSPGCPLRDYWVGSFGGPSARRFRDEIGFGVEYKQRELERLCSYKANSNKEGVPASGLIKQAVERSGLPASWFGLDPKHGLSTVYLKGTQEFSRDTLQVVIDSMEEVVSGESERDYLAGSYRREKIDRALAVMEADPVAEAVRRAKKLISQEVHYATVESVEEIDYQGWVYDFEVEDVHNYVAEGILCHNTPLAATACLRHDMPNLVFCPASVKPNWSREVQRWRPDLGPVAQIDTQATFRDSISEFLQEPGGVYIGSYGVLPGSPCRGCVYLRKTLKMLKKDKRYFGPLPPPCEHTSEDNLHPRTYKVVVDQRLQEIPYHDGCTDGCCQVNPLPEINVPVVLVGDEVHAFKTVGVRRTENWRKLRGRIMDAGGFCFGLSGTPCEGKPNEFYEVLRSLGLEKDAFENWGNYYRIFAGWFDNPKGRRKPPAGELREELRRRLKRVQINRRRKDVLDQLPPRTEEVIDVEMDEATLKEVNEAVHRMIAVKKAWEDAKGTQSYLRHLPRLANPYAPGISAAEKDRRKGLFDERVEYYFEARPWDTDTEIVKAVEAALTSVSELPTIEELARIRAMLSQAKVAAVQQWISDREQEEEPVVLFSQHVSILKKIAESRPGWECFWGGLTSKKRDEMVRRFQSGEIENGLAVSIGAGGEGITLTRARVCAFIDLNWNPAKNQQAESRLIRIGAEQHEQTAAKEALRLIQSGECEDCRIEGKEIVPCSEHQAKIVIVRFVAKHCVDQLVIQTLKEKETLLDAMEWEDEEVVGLAA